jgi:hypothetical protein
MQLNVFPTTLVDVRTQTQLIVVKCPLYIKSGVDGVEYVQNEAK